MSKISVSSDPPLPRDAQDARLVQALKNVTGLAIAEVRDRLERGRDAHLVRVELYLNDHVDVASSLRQLLAVLRQHGMAAFILEILDDESWEDPMDRGRSQMSEETLLHLLDEADGKFR